MSKEKDTDINFLAANNQMEVWELFLKRHCWEDITNLSCNYPDKLSLYVDFFAIDNYNSTLAEALTKKPYSNIDDATEALRSIDAGNGASLDGAHVRILNYPNKVKIRDIRSADVGRLRCIEGIVTKVTEVRPKIVEALFECPYCRHQFTEVMGESYHTPVVCPQCERKGSFKLSLHLSELVDTQKIRIQESPDELRGSELPQTIDVNLDYDLTGIVNPGNKVRVTGVLGTKGNAEKLPYLYLYLDANNLEKQDDEFQDVVISSEDEERIIALSKEPDLEDKLIGSLAPSIHGYQEVKEAILLQLFGGVSKTLPDGTRLRGDIHVLLVGDPGIAKSSMLTHTAKVAPRGLYAAGTSSSGVGLTAATVRDNEFGGGKWTLEAGTLVLADGGIAAIDEIEKMRDEEQQKLYEAMEQQAVTVAKAGINARLNARCAILVSANPKHGRFDCYEPIAAQIDLSPVLLSRFDLIFMMMDVPDEERDSKLAMHILDVHEMGKVLKRGEGVTEAYKKLIPVIEPDLLRKYIAYAKRYVPKLSEAAQRKLKDFYINMRRQYHNENTPVPTTARQLEALIRLSEAKARLRLSEVITEEDAEIVIGLVGHCLKTVFTDPETGKQDVDWVIAGKSKTQREREKDVLQIIKDLGGEVLISEVVTGAKDLGIDQAKTEKAIDAMATDGTLVKRKGGAVKYYE